MSTNTDKLYEHFGPQERLTLILEALARGDEADRLSGSCPRLQYTMRDAAFGDRLDTAFDIMSIACVDLRCLWGKLETLRWVTAVARRMATHHQISATFALLDGSAWIVENQGDHYWGSSGPQGPTAKTPFRLVEVPLGLP